jgi:hypothetical protein
VALARPTAITAAYPLAPFHLEDDDAKILLANNEIALNEVRAARGSVADPGAIVENRVGVVELVGQGLKNTALGSAIFPWVAPCRGDDICWHD